MANDHTLIRKLLLDLEGREDWKVRRRNNAKHNTVFPPNGHKIIQVPGTPADPRWKLNLRSELRRAGWDGTLLD